MVPWLGHGALQYTLPGLMQKFSNILVFSHTWQIMDRFWDDRGPLQAAAETPRIRLFVLPKGILRERWSVWKL